MTFNWYNFCQKQLIAKAETVNIRLELRSHHTHNYILRPFLLILTIVLTSLSCSSPAPRPNLIILFSDDAGYADFGFQGSTLIRTPHLDDLAESGIRFSSGYVTASVCSPSRAGMLTGRYQQRFGHELNLPGLRDPNAPDSARGLPLSERTIADLLSEAGYATGLVGKWHLGLEDHFHPTRRGFDEFFGMRKGSGPYFTGRNSTIENGMTLVDPDSLDYLTDEFGDQAVDFIARHRKEPFFLFLSFNAPHTPMQAHPEYLEEDQGRFRTTVRAKYASMTRSLDDNIGKVMATLEAFGLAENTLVFFANDNGGAMPFNGSLNAPLRGAKGTALEGGNRVAFLMSWKDTLPAGTVVDEMVSTLDVLPTFLAAAGVDLPGDRDYDGVNLLPFLTDESAAVPHDTLFWKMQWGAAVRAGDWKLVRTPLQEHWLFNLADDISESNDLSGDQPEILATLRQSLEAWESTHPDPVWVINLAWHARTLERYDQDVVDGYVRR
jgi:arylsulfatase A-like enzyme